MSLLAPWVGLVPTCQNAWEATMVPGYPADTFTCPSPARLLCQVHGAYGEDEDMLLCASCALSYDLVVMRALDHVDHACHVLGIVDAAMLELDADKLAMAAYGVLAVGPYQLDAPYLLGWNDLIGLRAAHLFAEGHDDD